MNQPNVDIIIVAKDQLTYTRQCVESILAGTKLPFRILFVDNASAADTSTYLREAATRCPSASSIEILRNDENVGWTKGVNQGIRRSAAPYVIIANNDIEVFPGAIEEMIAIAESDTAIGAVNPNSNEFDVPRSGYKNTETLKGKKTEMIHLAGFFMLIKRSVIERAGEFDEVYSPGYFEEMDYSERIRKAGLQCVIARGAYVFHHGSKSFRPEEKQRLWERNEKVFYSRWGADTRFAFVGGRAILRDEKLRASLTAAFLFLIRSKKAYAYLFLPRGCKQHFEPLHLYFRVIETPPGLRWLNLIFKMLRVPERKKIDTVVFVSQRQMSFWKSTGLFRNIRLELLPECGIGGVSSC
ncbi:MAG: Glycosyl transferase family 2 [Candidatus Omnitrophica bacterium ADurb.Bin277]|nr:MAG: Glycosyl transferase family 2 [Candidatus Omnitrophica bacterium ADurb.Bin277]